MSDNISDAVSEQSETELRSFSNPAWFKLTAPAERLLEGRYAQLGKEPHVKDEETGKTKITFLELFQIFGKEISGSIDSPLANGKFIWANNEETAPNGEEREFDMLVRIQVTEKGKNLLEYTYASNGRQAPTTDSLGRVQLSLRYVANIFGNDMTEGIDSPIDMEFNRVKDSEVIVQDISHMVSDEILEEHQGEAANDETYTTSGYDKEGNFHSIYNSEGEIITSANDEEYAKLKKAA